MKHKIMVYQGESLWYENGRAFRRWYVECSAKCHTRDDWPIGPDNYYGRRSWQEAFDLGVLHQHKEAEKVVAAWWEENFA